VVATGVATISMTTSFGSVPEEKPDPATSRNIVYYPAVTSVNEATTDSSAIETRTPSNNLPVTLNVI
jgi:hypothetical protein